MNTSTPLDAALEYLKRGWSPLCLNGKKPIGPWKQFQITRPTEEQLEAAFAANPGANVGIVMGRISGLVGLDIDNAAGQQLLLEWSQNSVSPTTAFSTPSGGFRLLYAIPKGASIPIRSFSNDAKESLRILGTGSQTVMPPSTGPNGVQYQWVGGAGLNDIDPALCPQWLLARLNTPPPAEQAQPTSNNPINPEERARRYVRASGPAIAGQAGHNQTFKLACTLVKTFGLDAETLYRVLLEEYNPRCTPPWSATELWHKVADATRAATTNRHAQATTTATAQAAGPSLVCEALAHDRPRPLDFLVPGYLPLGKLAMIAGDGGLGKSLLTLDLAAAITTGRPAFGLDYQPAPAAGVLIINCEDDRTDTIVPRLIAAGADLSRCHYVTATRNDRGQIEPFSLAHHQAMANTLLEHPDVRLVIIDPAAAYIGPHVDDYKDSELRALLAPLATVAAERAVVIIIVKHLNKGTSPKAVQRVAGSMAYINTVRAAYILTADQENPDTRLFLPLKYNLGQRPEGLAFNLQTLAQVERQRAAAQLAHLGPNDLELLLDQLCRLLWTGTTSLTADQAVITTHHTTKIKATMAWLKTFLAIYAYPAEEINTAAAAAGFSHDNVFRAKARLRDEAGLRNQKQSGQGGVWWSGIGPPLDWRFRPEPKPSETGPEAPPCPFH